MLVLFFITDNSIIIADYLSSFSFEQTNDTLSYRSFIILSILGITIINAKMDKNSVQKIR